MAATRNEEPQTNRSNRTLLRLEDASLTRRDNQAYPGSGRTPARERHVVHVQRASIRPRMQVYDHNGMHLGQIKEVREVDFSVDRAWRADIHVPIQRVLAVMNQDVFLTAA